LKIFAHQTYSLARLGMAVRLQLGIQQLPVYAHLEAASIGGRQGKRLDLGLELFEQVHRQTGGAIGVVSDSTVDDLDFQQHNLYLKKLTRMHRIERMGNSLYSL
jgi:hypothetical protein